MYCEIVVGSSTSSLVSNCTVIIMRVLNRSLMVECYLSFYMHALEEFHNCYTPHVLKIHVPFDRIAIQTIHIGKKGSGSKLHADHSRQPEEFELKSLIFVAENVSSDGTR